MKHRVLSFALIASLLLVTVVLAQSGGYSLNWWTVDGGGGKSTSSGYILEGTIGQPDAGPTLQGDGYTLQGGFWPGGVLAGTEYRIFLPLVLLDFG